MDGGLGKPAELKQGFREGAGNTIGLDGSRTTRRMMDGWIDKP